MSTFSRNVSANILGAGWTAVVQLAVVPLLVSRLGVESFALIGFYAAMLATLGILDLGLTPTLTRTMALLGVAPQGRRGGDVLRTFEWVFLVAGATTGAAVALCAPVIARHWLNTVSLGEQEVENALRLMGVLFALRWVAAPYTAVLQGLQRQVSLNAVNAVMVTVANAGALLALSWFDASIGTFLTWQCLAAAVQYAWMRGLAWRALPSQDAGPRFDHRVLLDSWRFSAGVTGITLMGIVLAQSDKIILSKLVSLEAYGYYSVAQVLVAGLQVVTLPVFNAAMPRLCELAAGGNEGGLHKFFRMSGELMAALLVPLALFLAIFADQIMLLWIGANETALHAAPLFQLLLVGALLNGLMTIPYALQLARGNTRLALGICAALCLVLVPAIFLLTERFGLAGGASAGILVNGLYMAFGLPLTYRLCLGSAAWPGYYLDLLKHQGPAVALLAAAWWFVPSDIVRPAVGALVLLGVLALAMLTSFACTPGARAMLRELLDGRVSRVNHAG